MNVAVTVQHAGNVHFFRHAIRRLARSGHDVHVYARVKEVNVDLLEGYDIDHTVVQSEPAGLVDLVLTELAYAVGLYREFRTFEPDVVLASSGVSAPYAARAVGARCLNFLDTESDVTLQNPLSTPLSDVIYTPDCLRTDFGEKQVRYDGLHELAYLHPNRFSPDRTVLVDRGVDPDAPLFLVRLNAWDAHHDVAKSGISDEGIRELLEVLDARGTVYVSHEDGHPPELAGYEPPVAPHEIHHLMAFADLFVGEVATMTVEAAVMGTPTVRLSPFATETDMGKFLALEREYGLIYSFHPTQERQMLSTVRALADDPGAVEAWTRRRRRLLEETIDVTDFIVDAVERQDRRRTRVPRTGA